MADPRWLHWARRLQALAQNGLTYTEGVFDRERYTELREIALGMIAALEGGEPEPLGALFAGEQGYATPKLDVRAVVLREGKLLLVRERDDGGWSLPGGWADVGDSPGEAAAKEVLQESGYRVRPVRLLALHDRDRHGHPPLAWHVWMVFLLCELEGGEATPSIETAEVGFFGPDEIPPLSLTRIVPAQLRRLYQLATDPDAAAEFD